MKIDPTKPLTDDEVAYLTNLGKLDVIAAAPATEQKPDDKAKPPVEPKA
jgi:hypothetical protein